MIQITIDHIAIKVPEGTTVLEAARAAGIEIPSMCYLKGHSNHPSCMVCLVKDNKTGNLTTSCALTATEGMDLSSNSPDVLEARKDALELLMSDHVGDCEAPCSLACPANMNIPQMNRLIAGGKFEQSLTVVKEDIALPYILGYICPAPCEKACRRKQVDEAVSVCILKRFVAAENSTKPFENNYSFNPLTSTEKSSQKKVAIIGTGPAGLSAAFYLLKFGYQITLFDKNAAAGGNLRYAIPDTELPKEVLEYEVELIKQMGATFIYNTLITKHLYESEIQNKFDAIVIATGDIAVENQLAELFQYSKSGIAVEEGSLAVSIPGVFACGSIIRPQKMAIRASAQGKQVALSVNKFLQGLPFEKLNRKFNSRFEKLLQNEYPEYLKESVSETRTDPKEGYLKGFTKEEAMLEASRCMHCDCRKLDSCKLRDYSDFYKVDRKKYLIGDRKLMTKHFQHSNVIYEPEKCIKCGLCIDITLESKEKTGLTFVGRGFNVQMQASLGAGFDEAITHTAIACVNACPTGALALK